MNFHLSRLATALVPAALLAAPLAAQESDAAGEAKLAEILEGRVAGAPVDCIRDDSADSLQIVDGTAMVFKRGDTIYVNRPEGAGTLDFWDLPVFHKFGSSKLCKLDRVELRDRHSHIPGPSLALARFIPYTRPAS